MQRTLVLWVLLVVAASAVQAETSRYLLYNLAKGASLAKPDDAEGFLRALRAKFGTTMPGLKEEGFGIQTGMPGSFRNSIHGACQQTATFALRSVNIWLYSNPPQAAAGGREICAFALEYRKLPWLWALVKADKKCEDAKFDDNARRLVMAFASKIGNYNHKGYVKDAELNSALDLFIAELRTRGVERMQNEEPVNAFETAVETMEVKAGMMWGNDTGAVLSKRALALLPSNLGN